MNIFKCTESVFDVYCQSKGMADFHILQGKLEPTTLKNFKIKLAAGVLFDYHIVQGRASSLPYKI